MIQRLKPLYLLVILGLASFVTLVVPALAISPGETVEFHVSADPDIWDHANAHATLSYYQSGSDQYVRVDVNWGKASIGGAWMYFEIGKEFTIIETNHPSPEHHITVAWHPWWTLELPIYGEGSRIMDSSGPGIYLASYFFIAKRVDYSSNEVWAELMVSVQGEMGSFEIDYDWQSLSLPASSPGGGGGGCPYVYTWNGQRYMMDNNLLPAAEHSNGVDVEDYYRLEQLLAPTYQGMLRSIYCLQIREFEHEHDYFDQVKLLAVDHNSDVKAAVTPYGEILTYNDPVPPVSAVDDNGVNVLLLLSSVDGNYYEGHNGSSIILNFGNVNSENAKLVLRTDRPPLKVSIHIQVQDSEGNWTEIARIIPRTYWATDILDISSYLPSSNTELKVRLYFTASHKIDYVGLDTTSQASIEIRQANLISAFHSTQGNVKPLLIKNDQTYAELIPGEQIQLTFLLRNNQNQERTFILYTEGHYNTIQ